MGFISMPLINYRSTLQLFDWTYLENGNRYEVALHGGLLTSSDVLWIGIVRFDLGLH